MFASSFVLIYNPVEIFRGHVLKSVHYDKSTLEICIITFNYGGSTTPRSENSRINKLKRRGRDSKIRDLAGRAAKSRYLIVMCWDR
jgi:hypothetical protein